MRCDQIDDLRNEGHRTEASLPQEAREHLDSCNRCREFQAFWDSPAATVKASPEVQTRITQQIVCSLRPVSRLPSNLVLVAWLSSLTAVAIAAGIWWLGAAGWQVLAPLQSATVFSLLGASIFLIANVLTNQMVPGARQRIAPSYAILGAFLSFLIAILLLFPYKLDPNFIEVGLRCWGRGLLVATGAAALFYPVLRRGAWLSPVRLGAAVGCLAGLAGLAALEITCPDLDREHIGVWHVGAALTATLIGAAIPYAAVTLNRPKLPERS